MHVASWIAVTSISQLEAVTSLPLLLVSAALFLSYSLIDQWMPLDQRMVSGPTRSSHLNPRYTWRFSEFLALGSHPSDVVSESVSSKQPTEAPKNVESKPASEPTVTATATTVNTVNKDGTAVLPAATNSWEAELQKYDVELEAETTSRAESPQPELTQPSATAHLISSRGPRLSHKLAQLGYRADTLLVILSASFAVPVVRLFAGLTVNKPPFSHREHVSILSCLGSECPRRL
jgi:hypothetical protein